MAHSNRKNIIYRNIYILSIYFLTCISQLQAEQNVNEIPEISNTYAQISEEQEYLIGREWFYKSSSTLPLLLNAPLVLDYVTQLSESLVTYTGIENLRLKVVLLSDPSINAFAAPGGIIGINLGLILAAENEDELASVIAHEFAHIQQKHMLEIITNIKKRSTLTTGTLLASLGMIVLGNPTVGLATALGSLANEANTTIDAIRANEEEADSIAFETMYKAGRDPTASLRISERLFKQNRDGNIPVVFRSHPLSAHRITALRNRHISLTKKIQTDFIQKPQEKLSANNFNMNVAQIVSGLHLSKDIKVYRDRLMTKSNQLMQESIKDSTLLGLAITHIALNDFDKAVILTNQLAKKYPLHPYVQATHAQALHKTGNKNKAKQILHTQSNIYPNNYFIHITEIQIYIDEKNFNVAKKNLEKLIQKDSENLWLWLTIFELYGNTSEIDFSHYANGHIQHLIGNNKGAFIQFELARDKTHNQRLRIQAQKEIEEIKKIQLQIENII